MTGFDLAHVFLQLAILLALAKSLGGIARWFGQPAVCGEILAGILLGPSLFGSVAPGAQAWLFPKGANATFLSGFGQVSVVLFLLVAGLELRVPEIRANARAAVAVSLAGILIPFALGFGIASVSPELVGYSGRTPPLPFALFFATALSISALPVILKTLIDLDLYSTRVGQVTVTAAIFEDLVGWIVFACILSMVGAPDTASLSIPGKIAATMAVALGILFVVRPAVHRILPRVGAKTSFLLVSAFLAAALTEWIGVHALFGAVMVGIAFGDSKRFPEDNRKSLGDAVASCFGPIFFAMIGLRVDFITHFDFGLALVVITIACIGKIVGCGGAARLAGFPAREAVALGFAMNSRGAMEIILGVVALQMGLIDERLFVALVVMAPFTSVLSGPVMKKLLR